MQFDKNRERTVPVKRIIFWLVALLVAAVIFLLSAQQASESKALSGQTIRIVASVLVPDFNELPAAQQAKIVAAWQGIARKTAHAFAYFILGSVCLLALLQHPLPMKKRLALALGISVVYAITDEVHQLFVDGRAFQFSDIGIDAAGASVGILLVLGVYYCWRLNR
jgi:VanZ family protein